MDRLYLTGPSSGDYVIIKELACLSEPFDICHPERSEGSWFLAQDQLREESHRINELENRYSSANAPE
jgi:hypothetical protein